MHIELQACFRVCKEKEEKNILIKKQRKYILHSSSTCPGGCSFISSNSGEYYCTRYALIMSFTRYYFVLIIFLDEHLDW